MTNIKKTYELEPGLHSGYLSEVLKSFCVIYVCKTLSSAKCLKQKTISPYACEFLSTAYLHFIPASGNFPLPIIHWAITTLGLYNISTFWRYRLNWSNCVKTLITKTGISIPSPTPSSKVQFFTLVTSFIQDDLLIYDNSVGVLDTICPNIIFQIDLIGV